MVRALTADHAASTTALLGALAGTGKTYIGQTVPEHFMRTES